MIKLLYYSCDPKVKNKKANYQRRSVSHCLVVWRCLRCVR